MSRYRVTVEESLKNLEPHRVGWENLGRAAAEPNVFYEPWLLIPALETFASNEALVFLLVSLEEPGQPPLSCGFFPFVRRHHFRGIPVRLLTLWTNPYLPLGAPLVHRDHAPAVFRAMVDWVRSSERGASVLEFPSFPGNGPLAEAWTQVTTELGLRNYRIADYTRAALLRHAEGGDYLEAGFPRKARREFERQRRRLAELGAVSVRELRSPDELDSWLDQFLQLEASGWKGAEASALLSSAADASFFRTACRGAWSHGQLQMFGLYLNETPIAVKCNFVQGGVGFTWKTAYDEQYARFGPGVQLELENVRRFQDGSPLRWMDSCADADNVLMNRVWKDRRPIQHFLVSSGRRRGNFVIGILPWLRSLKRLWKGRKSRGLLD